MWKKLSSKDEKDPLQELPKASSFVMKLSMVPVGKTMRIL